MRSVWLSSFTFFQVLVLSFQVNISPCKVDNLVTQPIYGTSSKTKALVQIIQIPPVFTQNVIVGKCLNTKEGPGNLNLDPDHPGQYFLCRQRYSSVEVYVSDQVLYSGINGTAQPELSPLEKFKTLNFVRDSVLVESGCDFTFNLLPLLLPQSQPQLRKHEDQHIYHFLRSPYHPSHPEKQGFPTAQLNSSSSAPWNAHPPAYTNNQGGNNIPYTQDFGGNIGIQQQRRFQTPTTYPNGLNNQESNRRDFPAGKHELNPLLVDAQGPNQAPSFTGTPNRPSSNSPHNLHSTGIFSQAQTQASGPAGFPNQNAPGQNVPRSDQIPRQIQQIPYPAQSHGRAHNGPGDTDEPYESDRILENSDFQSPSNEDSYSQGIPIISNQYAAEGTYDNYTTSGVGNSAADSAPNEHGEGIISTRYPVINDYTRNVTGIGEAGQEQGDTLRIVTYTGDNRQPQGYIVGERDEAELHALSDKIGVPLLILSRKFDPLLNNIEGEYFST